MSRGKITIIIVFSILLLAGGFFAHRSYSIAQFLRQAEKAFESGDYMAALANYFILREASPDDGEIAGKISEAKELLVTQENFKKAKEAAERGEWLSVKPLLSDIPSSLDSELYQEIISLYQQASLKVQVLEEKIAFEILALKEEATQIKKEKETAQAETEIIEGKLKDVQAQKEEIEKQAQIAQQETQAALQSVERERTEKFFNELSLLIDLLESGERLLFQAIGQIDSRNNITALSFLNQARSLFDSVKEHGQDLKENRTPQEHLNTVDKLLETSSLFVKGVLNLGSATVFIEEEETFSLYFGNGKEFFALGAVLLQELQAL